MPPPPSVASFVRRLNPVLPFAMLISSCVLRITCERTEDIVGAYRAVVNSFCRRGTPRGKTVAILDGATGAQEGVDAPSVLGLKGEPANATVPPPIRYIKQEEPVAIDSKNVYYIVEYLSYANPTLKEKDVRAMLDQIPAQKWTPLVLTATAWRNEAC